MNSSEQKPFLWGAATSGHQIEGGNIHSDWWAWEHEGNIEGGALSGAATDHWKHFREDIRKAADLGINSYRFSVEWSRIEPEQGQWDEAALDWYEDLIAECEKHRIIPMVTLHHFTSPKWFADQGGFTQENAPELFLRYARHVIDRLGGRVPYWCTLNEPMVLSVGSYLGKFMPPAVVAPELASKATAGMLKSHVLAFDLLHSQITPRQGPWKEIPIQVGIAHNMLDFLPDRRWNPFEQVFCLLLSRFYNHSWLKAVTGGKQNFGVPGLIPAASPVSEARGRRTVDFLGVNYYTKAYVRWRPKDFSPETPPQLPIGLSFARRKEPTSDLGWAIHPNGFRKILRQVRKYGLPILITENGIADRTDRLRPAYLFSHLREIAKAIQEGMDIRGYYHWSLLDNFEWIKGFGPRFGLYQIDYDTFQRTKTASACLYERLISAHRIQADGKASLLPPQRDRFGTR